MKLTCPRCGEEFRESEGFVTCWDCRKQDTEVRTGCRIFNAALNTRPVEIVRESRWEQMMRARKEHKERQAGYRNGN